MKSKLKLSSLIFVLVGCGAGIGTWERGSNPVVDRQSRDVSVKNDTYYKFFGTYQAGCSDGGKTVGVAPMKEEKFSVIVGNCLVPNFKRYPTGIKFELHANDAAPEIIGSSWFTESQHITCAGTTCTGEKSIERFDPEKHGDWGLRKANVDGSEQ